MEYESKINQAIISRNELLLMINDGDDEVRADLVAAIINDALAGDELLYRQLENYIENAIDLALALVAVLEAK